MNIVVAVERFMRDHPGGGYRIAWESAKALQRRGDEVTLIAESHTSELSSEAVEGVRVLRYPSQAKARNRFSARRAAVANALSERISAAPDLMIGHMPVQFWGAIDAFPQAKRAYVAHSSYGDEVWVGSEHKDLLLLAKAVVARYIERQTFARAERILVFSDFTRQLIRKRHGARFETKLQVTPAWTHPHAFAPTNDKAAAKRAVGWPIHVPVLFTLRRLVPRMGLDRLIAAAVQLHRQGLDFELYIAGEGPLRDKLQKQVDEANASSYIRLTGALPEAGLRAYYAAADAFVIPTKQLECFGLIAVEALSAGLPVLSTPVGALPEVIGPVERRWLAQGNSSAALAELLRDFLQRALPVHDPDRLHAFASDNYGAQALQRFCDLAIG